jgi:hypothetical protein
LQGDVFGLDMKYIGLIIPLPLIALAILKWDFLYLLGLSFGIGAEIKLIWFQVESQVYCPYCLFAAAVLLFLFLFNFRRSHTLSALSFVVVGFLFFHLFFQGSVRPSYGKTENHYTDPVVAFAWVNQKESALSGKTVMPPTGAEHIHA